LQQKSFLTCDWSNRAYLWRKKRHFLWLSVCQLHQKNRRDRWQVCTVADDTSRRSLSPLSFLLLQFFCLLSDEHITSSLHLFLLTTLLHSCLSAVYLFLFWLWQFCPEKRDRDRVIQSFASSEQEITSSFHRSPHNTTLCPSVCTVSPSLFSLNFLFLRSIMVILQVPMALHAQNRQKLLDRMRAQLEGAGRDSTNGLILLQVLSILPTTTTTSTTSLPPRLALPFLSFVPPASLRLMLSSAGQPCRGVPTRKPGADDCWDCRILMRFGVLSICSFLKTEWCSLTEFFLV
jgi:hypothetical protein